jgi:hypothetical protein
MGSLLTLSLNQYLQHKIYQEVYEMKGPLNKPTVKLVGEDGNTFSIMGRVNKALIQAGL